MLRSAGWNTYWLGKDHNVPAEEGNPGGPKSNWPLQQGFDRFYGFIGGETNQWYPTLTEDNHAIDQPYSPEEGYHFSKDITDQALRMLRDSQSSAPSRPWFMWLCPGANHAPHHVPKEWADKYKGQFDDGYEAYREWVLARMIEKGIMPPDTELTPINPMPEGTHSPNDDVRPWDSLSDDEKRLFARMAEVFAGFSEYTDHQVGRVIDYLEESGQLDNTIVMYCADNGASGEGGPDGSVNENKFFNNWPDDIAENLAHLEDLGSPNTYNHYPTGWAAAFSTPFKMFKRYSYAGGTCDPLVIHWPKGIAAKGEIRHQYHHVTDIVPTILDCCGLEFPDVVDGHEQVPLVGTSMRYTFDDGDAATHKERQYYCMLGTRGMWEKGWKAVAVHGPTSGIGNFDEDEWELYHVDEDRSEGRDLAAEQPERLKALIDLWFEEAEKYDVLPLDDRIPVEIIMDVRPQGEPPRSTYVYYPGTAEVPEAAAVNIRGRSYKILAEVDLTSPDAEGVIFAHGSRFGGHALFLKDQRLHYVYNFLGIPPEQDFVSDRLEPGRHVLGMEFTKESRGEHGESHGTTRLYVDDDGGRRGTDARAARVLRAVRRRPVRRPRLERRGQQPLQGPRHLQGRHDRAGRGQRRRRPVPRPREGGDGRAQSRVRLRQPPPRATQRQPPLAAGEEHRADRDEQVGDRGEPGQEEDRRSRAPRNTGRRRAGRGGREPAQPAPAPRPRPAPGGRWRTAPRRPGAAR